MVRVLYWYSVTGGDPDYTSSQTPHHGHGAEPHGAHYLRGHDMTENTNPMTIDEVRAGMLSATTTGEALATLGRGQAIVDAIGRRTFVDMLAVQRTNGEAIVIAYRKACEAAGQAKVVGVPTWGEVTKVVPEATILAAAGGRSKASLSEDLAVFTFTREDAHRDAWEQWRADEVKAGRDAPESVRGYLTFARRAHNALTSDDAAPQVAAAKTKAAKRNLAASLVAKAEDERRAKAEQDAAKAKADAAAVIDHVTHHPSENLVPLVGITGDEVMSLPLDTLRKAIAALSSVVSYREAAAKDEAKAAKASKGTKAETPESPESDEDEDETPDEDVAETREDLAAIVAAAVAQAMASLSK